MNVKLQLSHWFLKNYGVALDTAYACAPSFDIVADIVHTSYLELLEEPTRLRGDPTTDEKELLLLLRRIVRRVAQRHWDEKQRQTPEKLEKIGRFFQQIASEKEGEYRFEDEIVALRECLTKLNDKSRLLIEQHYFMKQKSQTIAKQFDASENAVNRALYRIRLKLKSCIRFVMQRREGHE